MILLMATGQIAPQSLRLNDDHAVFTLQSGGDAYRVMSVGLEQYNFMEKCPTSKNLRLDRLDTFSILVGH